MQDIATEHWNTFVSEKLKNEVPWMIKRHEVDYFNQAFLGDELQMGNMDRRLYQCNGNVITGSFARQTTKIISAASVWYRSTAKHNAQKNWWRDDQYLHKLNRSCAKAQEVILIGSSWTGIRADATKFCPRPENIETSTTAKKDNAGSAKQARRSSALLPAAQTLIVAVAL